MHFVAYESVTGTLNTMFFPVNIDPFSHLSCYGTVIVTPIKYLFF